MVTGWDQDRVRPHHQGPSQHRGHENRWQQHGSAYADGDGSNPRNLTKNPFFDGWPAWSPDGRKIAFASNRRGHGYQIFLMDAAGANLRLVANTEGRGTAPRWSPDGKAIYFTNCVAKDYGADCEILSAQP